MAENCVSATRAIDASAEIIFGFLADPANHAAIDGTGWVRDNPGSELLTACGQIFRTAMYHPDHLDGNYQTTDRVHVFDPTNAIDWEPGNDAGDGTLGFGGWTGRYDVVATGPWRCSLRLTYLGQQVPENIWERIGFPPFPPEHLANALAHLAELVAS
jgi:hypothetical protein